MRQLDREILRLALPALGALAADPLVSLIDTAFIGRLGAEALAGVAVAGAVFSVAFAVFNFLEYAVTPLVAGAVGRDDREEAAAATGAAFTMSAAAGIVAALVVFVLRDPVLSLFASDPAVVETAGEYLTIRLLALPAVMIVMAGHGVFRGFQDTRTPLLVTLLLNLVNLVLDPLLIFTAGWGVAGAATATVIAQWTGALLFVWLVFFRRRVALAAGLTGVGRRVARLLLGAGGKLAFRSLSLLAAMTASTAFAARIGTPELAAHQIALQLWLFLALVVDALAIAGQAMIGKRLGIAARDEAREVASRLLRMGVVFGGLLAVVLTVVRPWLGGWFTDDAAVIAALGSIYWFLVAAQPLNAVVFVWDGVAIGASAFRVLAWSTFAAAVIAVAVMAAGRQAGLGLPGVWWGLTAMMVVRGSALRWWIAAGPLAPARGPSRASRGA